MTAQTLFDMNQVVAQLGTAITHERFSGTRTGTVPPDAMEKLVDEIYDAYMTLEMLKEQDLNIPLLEVK